MTVFLPTCSHIQFVLVSEKMKVIHSLYQPPTIPLLTYYIKQLYTSYTCT